MENITKYFSAEKSESLLFILVGLIAVTIAIYLFVKIKLPFYNGMATALALIATVQLTVGVSVYFRSPKDIIRVENIIKTDKEKIVKEEIPRMDKVMKNFVIYRYIEIAFIIIGLIMMFLFKGNQLVNGLGMGLFIQSTMMLCLDFFAEKRGLEYLKYLKHL